jgi:CRP-like cAMP-binding protein
MESITEGRNRNKYKKKQVIYSEGNHPNRLYYVISGKVKAYRTNEQGKELVTDLYCRDDFFGYVAMLEQTVYKDTAEAMEETELAIIPKEDFDELIYTNTQLTKKFIQLLAKSFDEKERQLLGLAYNSLRKKVAEALIMLRNKYHQDQQENFVIDISRDSLATIAGTATESLIRTLSDFRTEKLIDIKDGSITIVNEEKLEHLFN